MLFSLFTPTCHVTQWAQKVTSVSKKPIIFNPPILLGQNGQVKKGGIVGTPPPDNTWHTSPGDAWHTLSTGSTSSEFFPRVHVARLSYPDPFKKRHTTLTNITSGRLPQHIRTTDIHYSDMFVWIIDWSKQVLHVITTACHGPHSATCRVKGQEWSDSKSLPTITSHDFWQSHQLPRSLSAAHRMMMALPLPSVIMTTQNISLPLKRVSLLYLVKDQLIYLSLNHGWQNHRRVRSDTLSRRLLQVSQLNQDSILVEIVRPSIWQLRGLLGTRCLNNININLYIYIFGTTILMF